MSSWQVLGRVNPNSYILCSGRPNVDFVRGLFPVSLSIHTTHADAHTHMRKQSRQIRLWHLHDS